MSSKSVRLGSWGYGVEYALKLNKTPWKKKKKEDPQKQGCCLFCSLSSLLCLQQCLTVSKYALSVHWKNVTARERMREWMRESDTARGQETVLCQKLDIKVERKCRQR